ncbi:MAG: TIGR03668 family PPOX class F420-dependent oxidoreductase [Acidimicrobiales bacterium]
MRLNVEQCRLRAASVPFAVLATTNGDGATDLVPITFAWAERGDVLVTAVDHKPKSTKNLARLANIEARPEVTILFDHRDPQDWDRLWWVRARGPATVHPPGHQVALLVARYAQYRDRVPDGPVIEVMVQHWHGWAASQP